MAAIREELNRWHRVPRLSEVPGAFTVIDVASTLDLSMDAADHVLRRRAFAGELERIHVAMRSHNGAAITGYVYRIPKAEAVEWNTIRRVLDRRRVTSTLPLIRKPASRADYDKLWDSRPSTTTRRLRELVEQGVLRQTYKRVQHQTGLSSIASFFTPAKIRKEER